MATSVEVNVWVLLTTLILVPGKCIIGTVEYPDQDQAGVLVCPSRKHSLKLPEDTYWSCKENQLQGSRLALAHSPMASRIWCGWVNIEFMVAQWANRFSPAQYNLLGGRVIHTLFHLIWSNWVSSESYWQMGNNGAKITFLPQFVKNLLQIKFRKVWHQCLFSTQIFPYSIWSSAPVMNTWYHYISP